MVEQAMTDASHDVDGILARLQPQLLDYRGGGWSALAMNYTRSTAFVTPDDLVAIDHNFCYISSPEHTVVTIAVRIQNT